MSPHDENELHALLCAYLLGETGPEETARVEAALDASEELRAERARLEATIGLVRESFPEGDERERLSERAMAALASAAEAHARPAAPSRASRLVARVPRPVWNLAALALVLASLYAAIRGGAGVPAPEVARESVAQLDEGDARAQRLEESGGESAPAGEPLDEAELFAKETPLPGADPAEVLDALAARGEGDSQAPVDAPAERELEVLQDLGYVGSAGEVAERPSSMPGAESDAHLGPGDSVPPGAPARPRAKEESEERPVLAEREIAFAGRPAPLITEVVPDSDEMRAPPPRSGGQDFFLGHGGEVGGGEAAPLLRAAPRVRDERRSSLEGVDHAPAITADELVRREQLGIASVATHPSAAGLLFQQLSRGAVVAGRSFDGVLADSGVDLRALGAARLGEWTPEQLDALVTLFLADCERRPRERPRDMFYRFWGDNDFVPAATDPLSTFSIDVDTASYALARAYLERGLLPEKAQVRTEEFVNYFDPDVEAPFEGTFRVVTDLGPSLFGPAGRDAWMLRVAVRGREVSKDERLPLSLTFVVDVSGSMREGGRLELVKHALRLLVGQLDARDSIAIVAFSNEARLVLPTTSAATRAVVEAAIFGLRPDGSTNAEAGLKLGYELALAARSPGQHDRVVLLSDGVANVGQTDQDRITEDVARHRAAGIYLNTVGVGMNNHDDVFLEQLADKGDGICNYVDDAAEAERALVERFTGAFEPIAKDVKIQVEFDPAQVASYRLLGYENRAVADRDFRDDAVDAGEVGAGHQVVALYEIVRRATAGEPDGALATVRLRWKPVRVEAFESASVSGAVELEHEVRASDASGSFEGMPAGFRRAALVAQFAELLRRSEHARGDSFDALVAEIAKLDREVDDPDLTELHALALQSRALILRALPEHSELARAIDAVRRNFYLEARLEDLEKELDAEVLERLEAENRELGELIRGLLYREVLAETPDDRR